MRPKDSKHQPANTCTEEEGLQAEHTSGCLSSDTAPGLPASGAESRGQTPPQEHSQESTPGRALRHAPRGDQYHSACWALEKPRGRESGQRLQEQSKKEQCRALGSAPGSATRWWGQWAARIQGGDPRRKGCAAPLADMWASDVRASGSRRFPLPTMTDWAAPALLPHRPPSADATIERATLWDLQEAV